MKALLFSLTLLLVSCSPVKWIYQMNLPEVSSKLCFIGDVGVGSSSQEKVAAALKKENCRWIHFLGDLVYPKGINSPQDPLFKNNFWKYYHDLPQMFLILGNHDYRQDFQHWIDLSALHTNLFFPHPYYLIKTKEVCIAHLDTNYHKLFIHFLKAYQEETWLNDIQHEMRDCKIKIALTHAPLKSRGKHHGAATGRIKTFLEDYIVGKFDYLISGHEHILSDEGSLNGTKMIISGAGGTPDNNEDAGFYVMTLKSGEVISEEFRRVPY